MVGGGSPLNSIITRLCEEESKMEKGNPLSAGTKVTCTSYARRRHLVDKKCRHSKFIGTEAELIALTQQNLPNATAGKYAWSYIVPLEKGFKKGKFLRKGIQRPVATSASVIVWIPGKPQNGITDPKNPSVRIVGVFTTI